MSAADWIALATIVLGGGGGGVIVAKGTRVAVAVENLVKAVEAARGDIKDIVGTVSGHETRISTLEGAKQAVQQSKP